jgi:hypothetical protein
MYKLQGPAMACPDLDSQWDTRDEIAHIRIFSQLHRPIERPERPPRRDISKISARE